ncbi:PfkB domain protein [Flavobacteria bacterium MS024-3C]|jgi:2-dehydro-3-deoxygluconokinase|nr:PfkB domain protein [Flavobacteria bacterium MS024-3C]KRO79111.1 MAG: 2-dehydro-3-deoxygluconokinase [Polaribacter sp. BACL8 MAG-120531-bin13]MDA8810261.1 sugar kinase [Flavobacteriaceae bacterium]MDA8931587.1 sugar kinase [Flavobacteriaceae bacterium]MDA9252642.1 sugar kinase [Flavobacteriaceae bacterium]|tara:strand:- start:1442 stop:2488 length:1047 start_codon:yes stop_codon:yes gene_type:complete
MKKVVTFGEIMLRLAPQEFLRFSQASSFDVVYGGGESNVAVSLANYGVPVNFVTRLPKNDIGECALMEMRKRGVNTDHIIIGGDRLGIYFLETGAVSRGSKVVYDRAHSAMSEIKPGMVDWEKAFEGADWFHWTGITPAISQSSADACLEAVQIASKMGLTISTDLNYRAKLWTYCDNSKREEIMTELTSYCDIVLGNEEDAEMHFGIKPEGISVQTEGHNVKAEAFLSVCEQMMKKFPRAKKVITTLRGSISASHNTWAGVLFDGKTLYTSPQYQITDIVDRVGGGDSFMGGLIYGLKQYPNDDQNALNFAVAASCLKHTIKGDANLVTVSEVEKLMGGDASGRVAR